LMPHRKRQVRKKENKVYVEDTISPSRKRREG